MIEINIQEVSPEAVKNFADAKEYFRDYAGNRRLLGYEGMKNTVGIERLYAACAYQNEMMSYYLLCGQKAACLLESTANRLQFDIVQNIEDFKTGESYNENIECAEKESADLSVDIFYQESCAAYRWHMSKNEKSYRAVYRLLDKADTPNACGALRKEARITLYDSDDSEIQVINCHSFINSGIRFLDLNRDGYVDIQVPAKNETDGCYYDLYLWNAENEQFEKVVYDGFLSEISAIDGGLKNQITNKKERVLEYLSWQGNELVLMKSLWLAVPFGDS